MIFPSTPKPLSCRIGSVDQNMISVAHNLRRIVSSRGGHRWTFSLAWPSGLSRSDISALWAFVVSMGGQATPFDFYAPFQAAQGSMAGSPVVSGAGQYGNSINCSGFTPSQPGVLKAGDYIRIAGSKKAHIITEDIASSADGAATLRIHPVLQSSPADGSAITAGGLFRVALASDSSEIDISDVLHYGLSLDFVEVLD